MAKTFIQTKEPELKNAFDEWIARIVCFAFSISPQPFINQMNRSTSETQKEMADEEGLLPILAWLKRLCDHVIRHMLGAENLEFVWTPERAVDPTLQRANLVAYVSAGMMTRRRAAEIMGETIPADPLADVLTVTTGQGVVRLGGAAEPSDVQKKSFDPDIEISAFSKYSADQPRGPDGRWSNASDFFGGATHTGNDARNPAGTTAHPNTVVAVNIGVGGDGGKNDSEEEERWEQMYGVGPTGSTNHGRTLTPGVPAVGGFGAPASSFSGSARFQLQAPDGVPPRNSPATVDGVPYSGHALDQTQNRGLVPSVINQAVTGDGRNPGKKAGTTEFYDPINDVRVIRDDKNGTVVTVIPGKRRERSE